MSLTRFALITERDAAQRTLGQLVPPAAIGRLRDWDAEESRARLADGRLASIRLADGTVLIPTVQFERGKQRPGPVGLAGQEAFAATDPTGVIALSWLWLAHRPFGFGWRGIAVLSDDPAGLDAVLALAARDAARVTAIAGGGA